MNISGFSVKRPVATLMIVCILLLLGGVSLFNIHTDLFPDVNLPVAAVTVQFRGASPEEVENIVTRNMENVLATVSNVDSIQSISSQENAVLIVQFLQNVNMDAAVMEMRERLDMITPYLPDDVSSPIIIKFDPNMLPMAGFSFSIDDMDMIESTQWAQDIVTPRLERIPGVAQVNITGGAQQEIHVQPDLDQMAQLGISMEMLSRMFMANNINLPGGIIQGDEHSFAVRTIGSFSDLEDVRNMYFMSPVQMRPVQLTDFASVDFVNTNLQNYASVNQNPSITLSIQRQSEYNTVEVMSSVHAELEAIQLDFPQSTFITTFDQSDYINMMVDNVSLNALIGALLAVLILFIFLKDYRATFIIGVAIPISVLAAFILIYFSGITLNIVSMGGLALGIGMLVDNSIVVLENIYRLRSEGKSKMESAIQGGKTIASAITASTLTTISVFVPVVFMQGMTGDIFQEMALTVTISLLASLFISLTLVPMVSSKILRADTSKHHKMMDFIKKYYTVILRWSLKRSVAILLVVLLLFGGSVYGVFQMGAEFFPDTDQGQFQITVQMPEGTPFGQTVVKVQEIETILTEYEEIQVVSASVSDQAGMFGFGSSQTDSGTLTVSLVSANQRSATTQQMADKIRTRLEAIEDAEIVVDAQGMMGMNMMMGSGIELEIYGDDLVILEEISNDLMDMLHRVNGISEVSSNLVYANPELHIRPKSFETSFAGLSSYQIGEVIQAQVQGISVSTARIDHKDYPIRIITPEVLSQDLGELQIPSQTHPQGYVTLDDVADIDQHQGIRSISRINQQRVVTLSTTLLDGYDPGRVGNNIEELLSDHDLPDGYSVEIAGESREIEQAFGDLYLALALGIVLIYMIMAAQFESLKYPFVILFSLPLAFTGGFLALFILGIPLSVTALIGMIVLMGIVVNNGIVLVDYINQLRDKGKELTQAVMEAGNIRIRPIFMTTLTTVLALVPLALGFGQGTEMLIPMSVTIIGGLLFSTIITLILIPCLYTLFSKKGKQS